MIQKKIATKNVCAQDARTNQNKTTIANETYDHDIPFADTEALNMPRGGGRR
jgi:hypothetical protein